MVAPGEPRSLGRGKGSLARQGEGTARSGKTRCLSGEGGKEASLALARPLPETIVRRTLILCSLSALALLAMGAVVPASGQPEEDPVEANTVRMARATWDTGWFQAEVYRLLLMRLGYRVEGPVTMENPDFYRAVAAGEVDLWVNGWFPTHDGLIEEDLVERIGTQVDAGALQGYFVDAATAGSHGITNLGDLADPEVARLFDLDADGRADLIGCETGWTCSHIIEHHLQAFGLDATVEQVQGDYSPLIAETIARFESGQPVLYYTWTPTWCGWRHRFPPCLPIRQPFSTRRR